MTSFSTSYGRIRRSYRDLGPARFALVNLFLLGWIGAFFYLAVTAEWPAGCGMDGVVRTYGCSVDLAATGDAKAVALAIWLWASPLLLILFMALRVRKLRRAAPPREISR